ncbi:hypothetical protein [Elioraea thermophila]|uniref:hypothetical protein n=1 Tax=Elioraea thermophila TaxID=2185104 RepID=UPI000DF312FD|nr:hypothetical protein [Elioraea thermophila]
MSEQRGTEVRTGPAGEGSADPFARAGLTLSAAERARLAEPIRLLEAMRARLRAAAATEEPATLFPPPKPWA